MRKWIGYVVLGCGVYLATFFSVTNYCYKNQEVLRKQLEGKFFRVEQRFLEQKRVEQNALRQASPWLAVQQQLKNTVVQIISEVYQFEWFEPYRTPEQQESGGSGFFIDDDGHIVTNYHVVQQSRVINVRLPYFGNELFEAKVVGASPERDIALLRLKEEPYKKLKEKLGGTIPHLELGDSDSVMRAQDIMALGYPLGQPNLKSTIGNVSGRERVGAQYYIQITAALNPGNSGGPSVDATGNVIGVNSRGVLLAQNVGYIIPINDVKSALKDLYKVELLRKPVLGGIFTPATEEMITYLGNPLPGGWYISRVFKNTILEKAGIQDGDMLYEVNGHTVDVHGDIYVSWSDDKVSLLDLFNRFVVGDKINFIIYRKGVRKEFSFVLEPHFLFPIRKMYPDFEKIDYEVLGGMVVMELTLNHVVLLLEKAPGLAPQFAQYLCPEQQYQPEPILFISNIFPDSPAKKAKVLTIGTFIDEVNGKRVTTLEEFRKAIRQHSRSSKFLTIKSKDERRLAVLSVEKILGQEDRLVAQYFYKKSSLINDLK